MTSATRQDTDAASADHLTGSTRGRGRAQHVVVIPVKPPGIGKTRLVGVPAEQRVALATRLRHRHRRRPASRPRGVSQVLVTTDDARFAATLTAWEPRRAPTAATASTRHSSRRPRRPRAGGRTCDRSRCAPTCRHSAPRTSQRPWRRSPAATAYVADAAGTGTTLYTASYDDFAPRFGVDSAAAHAAAGAAPVTGRAAPGSGRTSTTWSACRPRSRSGVGPATRRSPRARSRLRDNERRAALVMRTARRG